MERTIEDARSIGERRICRKLSDGEFADALAYAQLKATAQGNGLSYVPLLLPDVIQEREFEIESLSTYRSMVAAQKEEADRWKRFCGITEDQLAQLRQKAPELIASASAAGFPF